MRMGFQLQTCLLNSSNGYVPVVSSLVAYSNYPSCRQCRKTLVISPVPSPRTDTPAVHLHPAVDRTQPRLKHSRPVRPVSSDTIVIIIIVVIVVIIIALLAHTATDSLHSQERVDIDPLVVTDVVQLRPIVRQPVGRDEHKLRVNERV